MSAVVLTSETFPEFAAAKLALREPAAAPATEPAKSAEGGGEPAVESATEPKAQPAEEATDAQIPNQEARQKVNLRFSELSEARKAAEAKATQAEADAKAARDALALAEQRAAELQAKYEPPKPDELGPEPAREQFVNDAEYKAALMEYAGDKAIRERDQRQAQERMAKSWSERQAKAKAEIPDYDATMASASNLMVSNQVRDAILESEVGPKILHHLAKNPALVNDLAKMSPTAALLTIGRLDAKFAPAAASEPAKGAAAPAAVASEPSRAPAPITPLKGTSAPAASLLDSNGVFHGTHAQWKEARKAGKLK